MAFPNSQNPNAMNKTDAFFSQTSPTPKALSIEKLMKEIKLVVTEKQAFFT